ncbi:MAG TPA: hypothetical protein VK458_28865 [Myxococcaceae bacterium]|nr:hypothetical protein [Myxococcaceae bacterium]
MDTVERQDGTPEAQRRRNRVAGWFARGIPSAGIYAGPLAWLVSTQANYSLVPWMCAHQIKIVPVVALAMAALSLFGGFLSWRGYVMVAPASHGDSTGAGRPHRFVALMGIGMALLFTVIIALHGVAGMMFHGCER